MGGKTMSKVSLRVLSALLVLGCGSVASAEPTKMRLGFSGSAGFVSAMVAKDKGFFDRRNLDVEMVFVTKGSIVVPSILGGSLEAGTMTSPSLIRGVEANM
jgi:ABC-type nitrate/sulfonate/bicarbonate transport system substrate-binding protein